MSHHRRASFFIVAALSVAAAAGCQQSELAAPGPQAAATIAASPSTVAFALNDTAPASVTVTRSSGTFAGLAAVASDPTVVGIGIPILSGSTATVSVLPVGSADGAPVTVHLTDASGATASFTVDPATCGRPPDMTADTTLIAPAPGATHVPAGVGTLYFAVYSHSPQFVTTMHAHLVIDGTQTLDDSAPLVQATPPGGAPTPAPLPGLYEYLAAGPIPMLPSGASIRAYLYDDTCQAPTAAGGFST